jgi:hypothetical protein
MKISVKYNYLISSVVESEGLTPLRLKPIVAYDSDPLLSIFHAYGEPGSSVSIVTGCGLGDQGSIPNGGGGFFLYPASSRLLGPSSLLQWVPGSSLGVNAARACC